eukprot:scaffold8140_cov134-Isochrysis_galbana.AAC.5
MCLRLLLCDTRDKGGCGRGVVRSQNNSPQLPQPTNRRNPSVHADDRHLALPLPDEFPPDRADLEHAIRGLYPFSAAALVRALGLRNHAGAAARLAGAGGSPGERRVGEGWAVRPGVPQSVGPAGSPVAAPVGAQDGAARAVAQHAQACGQDGPARQGPVERHGCARHPDGDRDAVGLRRVDARVEVV